MNGTLTLKLMLKEVPLFYELWMMTGSLALCHNCEPSFADSQPSATWNNSKQMGKPALRGSIQSRGSLLQHLANSRGSLSHSSRELPNHKPEQTQVKRDHREDDNDTSLPGLLSQDSFDSDAESDNNEGGQ